MLYAAQSALQYGIKNKMRWREKKLKRLEKKVHKREYNKGFNKKKKAAKKEMDIDWGLPE